MLYRTLRYFRSSCALKRIETFTIPQPGEGIAEVEILSWLIKPGDKVSEYDVLCEARSDKGFIEYKSEYDGVIKELIYKPQDMAPIGGQLYKIDIDDVKYPPRGAPAPSCAATASHTNVPIPPLEVAEEPKVLTTPAVRHLAKANRIDLKRVRPTGRDGRITKEDVLRYMQNGERDEAIAQQLESVKAEAEIKQEAIVQEEPIQRVVINKGEDRTKKLTALQKAMVKSMTESLKIPHLTYNEDVYMDNLITVREQLKKQVPDKVKLTYMPFFMKALSMAISDFPIVNCSLSSDLSDYTEHSSHNISIAMDTPAGLMVPVVKNCESLSILEIASEIQRLQDLGKKGRLADCDLRGGTISLSNIGNIGGTYNRPIIVSPQVMIGGLGSMRPRLELSSGSVVEKQIICTSWSADHRIIDGATTARFVRRWKELVEQPSLMLLSLK
jgi:2-oxoisovalerate dehydrogenase E2 component (dihydrolipoyl transacylase)